MLKARRIRYFNFFSKKQKTKEQLEKEILTSCINNDFKDVQNALNEAKIYQYDVDMNNMCEMGMTPLSFAIANKNTSLIKLLSANGSDVNYKETDVDYTPLKSALLVDDIEVMQSLTEAYKGEISLENWETAIGVTQNTDRVFKSLGALTNAKPAATSQNSISSIQTPD